MYVNLFTCINFAVEAPIITHPPKREHKAAEGRDTQLQCLVFGSPRPLVVWKKGSEQLTGGRFTVTEFGHLGISVSNQNSTQYVFFSVNTKSVCAI